MCRSPARRSSAVGSGRHAAERLGHRQASTGGSDDRKPPGATTRVGSFRWSICGLRFLAATINYSDRQVIGIRKPTLQAQFGWSEIDYGDLVFAFQTAYAIGFIFAGRLMDRVGTKVGYSLALALWSLAAMATAGATIYGPAVAALLAVVGLTYSASVAGFMAARFLLGLGESGNFPAAIKIVAEWFPQRERALATGLFNAGTNVGAIIAPLVVPYLTVWFGWRWAFIATGLLGVGWLVVWWALYDRPERHRLLSPSERAYIAGDPSEPTTAVPWRTLLPHPQTWAFAVAKFMTDPIWWVYLFWIPDFFGRNYGLSLLEIGPPIIVIISLPMSGRVRRLAVVLAHSPRLTVNARARPRCSSARWPWCRSWRRTRAQHVGRRGARQPRRRGARVVRERCRSRPTCFRDAVGSVVGLGGMAARSAGC